MQTPTIVSSADIFFYRRYCRTYYGIGDGQQRPSFVVPVAHEEDDAKPLAGVSALSWTLVVG